MTGRKAEVSDEQVIEAGKQLQAEGNRITGFSLRKRIGAGTPARLYDVWKAKGQSAPPSVVTEEESDLPIELADHVKEAALILGEKLMTMARDMNSIANRTHERRVRDWITKAEEKTRQAEAEVADAGQLFEEAEQRALDAEERIKELEAELKHGQQAAQQQRIELTETKTQLTATNREIDSLSGKLEKAELERENFKDLVSESNGRLKVLEDRLDELKAENAKLSDSKVKLEQSNSNLSFKLEQAEKGLEKCSKDRDERGQEARRLRSQVAKLEGKEESLNAQLVQLGEQLKISEAQSRESLNKLADAKHEIYVLKNPTPQAPNLGNPPE